MTSRFIQVFHNVDLFLSAGDLFENFNSNLELLYIMHTNLCCKRNGRFYIDLSLKQELFHEMNSQQRKKFAANLNNQTKLLPD